MAKFAGKRAHLTSGIAKRPSQPTSVAKLYKPFAVKSKNA